MNKTRILSLSFAFAVATLVSACDADGRLTPFHLEHTGDINLSVPDSSVPEFTDPSVIQGFDLPYPTGYPVG